MKLSPLCNLGDFFLTPCVNMLVKMDILLKIKINCIFYITRHQNMAICTRDPLKTTI